MAEITSGGSFQLPSELLEVMSSFLDVKSFAAASALNSELRESFRNCGRSFWKQSALILFPILKETISILPQPVDYKQLMKKQLFFRSNEKRQRSNNGFDFTRSLDEFVFSFALSSSDGRSLATGVGNPHEGLSCVRSERLTEAESADLYKNRLKMKMTWQVTDRKTGLSAHIYSGISDQFEDDHFMFSFEELEDMFEGPSSAPWRPASLHGEGHLVFDDISVMGETVLCAGGCNVSFSLWWVDLEGVDLESGELCDLSYLLENRTEFR